MHLKYIESKCSGCRTCQMACSLMNFKVNNPSKSMLRIDGRFPDPGNYDVRVCVQCGACATVCPVDAIEEKNGVYRIDHETCIGCMACVEVCPNDVIMVHEDNDKPFKCINCGACVNICPRDALEFVK